MRIEAHNRLGQPVRLEVTRVVVYDDRDNPVCVAVKHAENWVYVGHVRDPEFADYLSALGIDKTYVVDDLDPKRLPRIPDKGKLL